MTGPGLGRVGVAAAVALPALALPTVSAIAPIRRRAWPALSGVGAPGHVALTFDDGPDPASTPAFIEVLAELDVTATFFLLGRMLRHNPGVGHDLFTAGHELALHGWDHRAVVVRGPRSTGRDLARGHREIIRVSGHPPRFYRPPYGVMSWSAHRHARRLGLTPVLWTTWGRDWRATATGESVRRTVGRHLGPGGTVLLHDSDCTSAPGSWRSTLAALPGIVADIRAAGLAVGPLRDHGLVPTPVVIRQRR